MTSLREKLRPYVPLPLRNVANHSLNLARPALVRAFQFRDEVSGSVEAYASAALALTRFRPTVLDVAKGGTEILGARRVAVFCHFDAEGRVSAAALAYVKALAAEGFRVVFVTAGPVLDEAAQRALAPHCALMIRRENVGYDFGAWRDGIRHIPDLAALDELVIANDSVLGPFAPLTGILERCDDSADIWGLTDSDERGWHLQSFFVLFRASALRHPAFKAFWRGVLMARSKHWAIMWGELRLSHSLVAAGLRLAAVFPTAKVIQRADPPSSVLATPAHVGRLDQGERIALMRRGVLLNPSHVLWRELIEAWGFPFIKRELLTKNPMQLEDVPSWRAVVAARFGETVLSELGL